MKPTAWWANSIGPSVTLTSTTPDPPRAMADVCMRSMADSRAAYMASVKLVSSTFWPDCFMVAPIDRRGA